RGGPAAGVDEPRKRPDRRGGERRAGGRGAEDEDEPVVERTETLAERRPSARRKTLGDPKLEAGGLEETVHGAILAQSRAKSRSGRRHAPPRSPSSRARLFFPRCTRCSRAPEPARH